MKKSGGPSLSLLWKRYKASPYSSITLYVVMFLACIALVWIVIIPQIQQFLSLQQQVSDTQKVTEKLRNNIAYLKNGVNDTELASTIQTVTTALPYSKDASSVLDGVTDAAAEASVNVQDYSFSVGTIGSGSAVLKDPQDKNVVSVTIIIDGGMDGAIAFTKAIQKKFPLAEVSTLTLDAEQTSVTILFHYQPLPRIVYNDTDPIKGISKSSQATVTKLSSWVTPTPSDEPAASISAEPL